MPPVPPNGPRMTVVARASARLVVLLLALLALFAAQAWAAAPARAAGGPVYDSIPETPPASYPSLGYQATQTAELGDLVELAGTDRDLQTITVGLVSWACETGGGETCATTPGSSFTHPITITLYEEGTAPAPGAVIATLTKDVAVPYRPSADPSCPSATQWYSEVLDTCQNGFLFLEEFDFASQVVSLPDRVVVSVSFNTNTWGYEPIGAPGPYQSLNVAVISTAPTVGTDVDEDVMYWAGGKPVSPFVADSGWKNPSPQWGLSLRIVATDLLATLPQPEPTSTGDAGDDDVELPTLAATGAEPSPVVGIVGGAVILVGAVLLALAVGRRRGAHRA